jgi:hypothetical protein
MADGDKTSVDKFSIRTWTVKPAPPDMSTASLGREPSCRIAHAGLNPHAFKFVCFHGQAEIMKMAG